MQQMRLFVGIGVPPGVASRLAACAPRPGHGIRRVAPVDMHVTLHFIGRADVGRAVAALSAVTVPRFELSVDGIGHFTRRGRVHAVWVGIGPDRGLLRLHRSIGTALAAAGFSVETRPYRPHVTLARLGPDARSAAALRGDAATVTDGFPVDRFTLYASGAPGAGNGRYTPRLIVVLD